MEEFAALSPAGKVESILAIIKEPLSKKSIFDLAGIDPLKISRIELDQVNAVLQKWIVLNHQNDLEPIYWVPPELQEGVITRIGIASKNVRKRLIESAWKDLGLSHS